MSIQFSHKARTSSPTENRRVVTGLLSLAFMFLAAFSPNAANAQCGAGIASIPGTSLWLKAGVGMTVDGSGLVSQWADQSGLAHDASASGANQPQFITSPPNGYPAVQFNGSTTNMDVVGKLVNSRNAFTVLIKSYTDSAGPQTQEIISNWNAPFTGMFFGRRNGTQWGFTDDWTPATGSSILMTTPTVMTFRSSATNAEIFENGTLQTQKGSNLTGNPGGNEIDEDAPWVLGRQGTFSGGEYFRGYLQEIVVFDRVLDDTERAQAEACLALEPQTCLDPPSGMVSWYDMEGSANDRLGNNNPSSTSAISFVPGMVGQGVTFGSGGFIDVADSPSLQLQQLTLDAWVKPNGAGPNNDAAGSIIVGKNINSNDVSAQLAWTTQNGGRFRFNFDGGSIVSADAFPAGAFYHIAGTYDGATFRLYVNGVLEGSVAQITTITYSALPWNIGANTPSARSIGFARTFNGIIDEVEIFDRALSASEAAALHLAGSAGKCRCGNGTVDTGEDCEDGNAIDGDGCDSNCTFTGCGNGIATSGEQCDDGNTTSGDCCSATCQFEASGNSCPDEGNACTTEACDGAGSCVHTAGNTGAVCRPADGDCDVQETCDGSATCPPDEFADSSVVCRIAAGDCDLADHCSGSEADCPEDGKSTDPCRPAAGDCDAMESCDGVNNDCPADVLEPDTHVCRVPVGACDLADSCTGTDVDCPADTKSTEVCRGAISVCDLAESCDGASNACPADTLVSDGTSCNDGNLCTSADQCSGGVCVGSSLPNGTSCSDGSSCTTGDQCSGGVCSGASQPNGTPCDDGNICTIFDQCLFGACVLGSPIDGPSCNDGNPCTTGDQCQSGVCGGTSKPDGTSCISPNDCMSGGQCVAGACDSELRPNGTPCNDHNFCTSFDQCLGGTCNGAPKTDGAECSDLNSCTNGDECTNGVCGGVAQADDTACDDENSCTANDECAGGVCIGTGVENGRPCSDGQSCTTSDQCMFAVCQGTGQSDGTPCNDGTACTGSDQCVSGECTGTPANDGAACSEGCTTGTCDAGLCEGAASSDGTLCSDGAVCTRNDACVDGVCTGEPGCVDPYLCYKTKVTQYSTLPLVLLHDDFETTQATVSKPKDLCLPADADGEGVVDPVTHQQTYPFKQTVEHTKQLDITVTDAFGTLELDTVKPARLLVPTNKDLGSPPSGPPAIGVADHFKCYRVKITKDTATFPKGTQVTVTDQFQTSLRVYDVKKPKLLCNPVDKNGEGIQHSLDRLVCYQVKPIKGEPKFAPIAGQIFLENQFGPGRVDAIKENVLCVPATQMP